jgi:GNAT superfamily N-acetyltransferase
VATDAKERQLPFLRSLLTKPQTHFLVHEDAGRIDGFIVASVLESPSVYDPGGTLCFVDDFMVAKPELWAKVGKELLEEAFRESKNGGTVLANVVCGPNDLPKRGMLQALGFGIASEWFVKSLH